MTKAAERTKREGRKGRQRAGGEGRERREGERAYLYTAATFFPLRVFYPLLLCTLCTPVSQLLLRGSRRGCRRVVGVGGGGVGGLWHNESKVVTCEFTSLCTLLVVHSETTLTIVVSLR